MKLIAPRIHVLFAREAPIGLVIRRGPSKQVATILWDRLRDEFQLGQWLKGRIYEYKCDLSPDGKYFLYFAMNGKTHTANRGSWTAISQAPFLKAIDLFAHGDCWGGGGLWTSPTTYWLNRDDRPVANHHSKPVRRVQYDQPTESDKAERRSVYWLRLVRDGWTFVNHERHNNENEQDCFEKPIGHGWMLIKRVMNGTNRLPGRATEWDEHELEHRDSKVTISCHHWEWADFDCARNRLAWATGGCLYTANIAASGMVNEVVLGNFNEMTFRRIVAPYC